MAILSSLFAPKYKLFFNLFEKSSNQLVIISNEFLNLTNCTLFEDMELSNHKIKAIERETDTFTRQLLTELSKNFITPFDREDIHDLTNRLDDVADHIQTSANRIVLYHLHPIDQFVAQFARLIHEGIAALNIAVGQLRELKDKKIVLEALEKINVVEKKADDLYEYSIKKLFESENDMKEFIKKRDIYQKLELVTDVIEDAGNVIENIMIKYA